jgi:molecular chaperone GrpE (heat shock protein)
VLAGREQAQKELDTEARSAMSELIRLLADSHQTREEIRRSIQADAGKAVAAVIRKLCPRLASIGLADAASELMNESLKKVPRPIIIGAAPSTAEALTGLLQTEHVGEIEICERADLSSSHLKIDWTDGSAEIDFDKICHQIFVLAGELDIGTPSTLERNAQ